ncbi:MAG TPA: hypothetical protein VGK99_22560 [Acidobacteriota bacterium]
MGTATKVGAAITGGGILILMIGGKEVRIGGGGKRKTGTDSAFSSIFRNSRSVVRLAVFLPACCFAVGASQAATHALILRGLGGDAAYEQLFSQWTADLSARLISNGDSLVTLAPQGANSINRENILQAISKYQTLGKGDLLLVFLLGHGSFDQKNYRFNIPGPDMTDVELAGALRKVTAPVVVINGTSASGASLAALSAKDRVVITATRSGSETVPPRFAGFLIEGLRGGADADKNGSISLLELFQYARKQTAEWYQSQNRLASEHSLLDDNGDAKGIDNPAPGTEDGALAASLRIVSLVPAGAAQNVGRDLLDRKQQLEAEIEKLRFRKSEMKEEEYQKELEKLVLELAKINRLIKGDKP